MHHEYIVYMSICYYLSIFSILTYDIYAIVGDQVEVLDDGSYWYEIEGIGDIDPQEDQDYPTAHKHTRITFNTGNIKVRVPLYNYTSTQVQVKLQVY